MAPYSRASGVIPALSGVARARGGRYNGAMSTALEPTHAWSNRTRAFPSEGPLRGGTGRPAVEPLQTALAVALALVAALLIIGLGTLLRASPPQPLRALAGSERLKEEAVARVPSEPALYPPVTGSFMAPRGSMLTAARRPAITVYALTPARDLSGGLPSPSWTADENGLLHGAPVRPAPEDILD